jgi:carbonic anhydrase/acetyltransferase-like protein (isoleucine patch superfamily)
VSRTTIQAFHDRTPRIDSTVFVDDRARIIGAVELGEESSVWPNAVLRGDIQPITVGRRVNIQDNVTIHTAYRRGTTIGDHVSVGHGAILHGCDVGDHVIVGMGAILLDAAQIEARVLIGAGTLIPPGTTCPSGHLVLGVPGKPVRRLRDEEVAFIETNATRYVELARRYARLRAGE